MTKNKDILTYDEAVALLPDGDYVHTFRNPSGILLGADWARERILHLLRRADVIHQTGGTAANMGHGICITHRNEPLFIATRDWKEDLRNAAPDRK